MTEHYYIGKISEKKQIREGIPYLKKKYTNYNLIVEELSHMESNIHDDIEYYTAFKLLKKYLEDLNN